MGQGQSHQLAQEPTVTIFCTTSLITVCDMHSFKKQNISEYNKTKPWNNTNQQGSPIDRRYQSIATVRQPGDDSFSAV